MPKDMRFLIFQEYLIPPNEWSKERVLFSEAWFDTRPIQSDYSIGWICYVFEQKNLLSFDDRTKISSVFLKESLIKLNRRNSIDRTAQHDGKISNRRNSDGSESVDYENNRNALISIRPGNL